MNNEHIGAPCNISSGMFGIRYSYSDHYYATDGEDRGCSSTDGSTSFNASQGRRSVHRIFSYLGLFLSTATNTITLTISIMKTLEHDNIMILTGFTSSSAMYRI
jgi:hypothetical protein